MLINTKYSISLSIVGGRNLSLKLGSKNLLLLEDAFFFLPLFLVYNKPTISYLKPLGPDELGNSLFIGFWKVHI